MGGGSAEDSGFNFDELGLPFDLPSGVGGFLLRAVVHSSSTLRSIYNEHTKNGFTDDEAMKLVLSLQRDVVMGIAKIGAELAKISVAGQFQQPPGGDQSPPVRPDQTG